MHLTNVQEGDITIVINDPTAINNGSYIYNGSVWSTLSLYISPINMSSLNDVTLSTILTNQVLQ